MVRKVVFLLALALCLTPWISSPVALVAGFLFAHFIGHPFIDFNHKATKWLLKIAVVGLGFGININEAIRVGGEGIQLTVISIIAIFALGFLTRRLWKINPNITHLISSGTAICGGSAIAAVAPILNATEKEMSVALGTVFLLNAIALIIFPPIGHFFELSQYQFGLWAAVAIHDTSSVVGAAATYGKEALDVATIVKLARALWIIPVALLTSLVFRNQKKNVSIPWFIGFFILAVLANSYIPAISAISEPIIDISRSALVVTLFLIGAGLSVEKIKAVGFKPLTLGIILWVFIAVASLTVIMNF